MIKCLSTTH